MGSLTRRVSGNTVSSQYHQRAGPGGTHYAGKRNAPWRHIVTPESEHSGKRSNFERDQEGFVDKEVPACHERQRLVYEFASKSNKSSRQGIQNSHLSNAIVDEAKHDTLGHVRNKQAARATFVQTSTDRNEERSTDRASDGDELDLAVVQSAMQMVSVLRDLAILGGDNVVVVRRRSGVLVDLLLRRLLVPERHGGQGRDSRQLGSPNSPAGPGGVSGGEDRTRKLGEVVHAGLCNST